MILVIGGAGYIGSHTVKYLIDCGYDVIVADNLVYGHKEAVDSRAKFILADLLDINSIKIIFENYFIEAVVHFAAFAYVGESVINPKKYYINNTIGTLNLLHTMLEYGCKNLVFSSTCATYGEPKYLPIDEEHSQNPINPYGKSKLFIESILQDYHKAYGINYIALRYFNAAGASFDGSIGESHEPETHLIPLVLKSIKGDIPHIKIYGNNYPTEDGTCVRDFIHVEDLALAHKLALDKISTFSGYINLGTGVGISVKSIIDKAEKITGMKCNVVYVARREGDPALLYANNKKAKDILGWSSSKTINDIILTAWNWENRKRF